MPDPKSRARLDKAKHIDIEKISNGWIVTERGENFQDKMRTFYSENPLFSNLKSDKNSSHRRGSPFRKDKDKNTFHK